MTTPAVVRPVTQKTHVPNRLWDRFFFSGMSLLILAMILYGFARTYFLAGMVRAPLPNLLIHIHGAAFTSWIALLLVQNALVATHNTRIHKKLGLFGFGLAVSMVVLGVLAAIDALRRGSGPLGLDPKSFFIIPISDMLLFAIFIFASFRARLRPEAHKRLILIATIALTDAAIGRFPIAILQQHPPYQDYVMFALLLFVMAYDLISPRRVSRTTLWASALVVVVRLTRVPIGLSAPWHTFASLFLPKG